MQINPGKTTLVILTIVLMTFSNAFAQTIPQTADVVQMLDKALSEVEADRRLIEADKVLMDAQKRQIDALTSLTTAQDLLNQALQKQNERLVAIKCNES